MNEIIIIPAYNPPKTFKSLLDAILNISPQNILIIDDGSFPKIDFIHKRVTVLRNKRNMGKGFSLLKAFKYSLKNNINYCVTIDADSQHDPKFIKNFFTYDKNITILIGKRKFSTEMPFLRRISNMLTSYIISFICSANVYDSQCGFRRYKIDDILKFNYIEKGFQFESEILLKILKNSYKIDHIDISTIYNQEKSFINNTKDTFKFISLIIRNLI
jgi:glycosyltransferase involved in cell wall biosynthesis